MELGATGGGSAQQEGDLERLCGLPLSIQRHFRSLAGDQKVDFCENGGSFSTSLAEPAFRRRSSDEIPHQLVGREADFPPETRSLRSRRCLMHCHSSLARMNIHYRSGVR